VKFEIENNSPLVENGSKMQCHSFPSMPLAWTPLSMGAMRRACRGERPPCVNTGWGLVIWVNIAVSNTENPYHQRRFRTFFTFSRASIHFDLRSVRRPALPPIHGGRGQKFWLLFPSTVIGGGDGNIGWNLHFHLFRNPLSAPLVSNFQPSSFQTPIIL
jgi:hypothetical protein